MIDNKLEWRLLKRLYSIHSPSGKEHKMIGFLLNHLKDIVPDIKMTKDGNGNIYIKKGDAQTYPCMVAHLDQVQHNYPKDFKAIETRDIIFGYSPSEHSYIGPGADDKNGVFLCIEALKKYDCLKVALFTREEVGCIGSNNCDMEFFKDCRFVIQCDRKGNSDFITTIGWSEICSDKFIQDVTPEKWGYQHGIGMMTDVQALHERGLGVSAVNLSCGYYNPHSDEELTVKADLVKCWRLVQHIIEDCTETYTHESDPFGQHFTEWDMEEEIYDILNNDPTLNGDDLYDMYHTNFTRLKREDFRQIAEEYRLLYGYDFNDEIQNPKENGKENNDKEDLGF